MADVRNIIVDWAKWAVNHKDQIHYSEAANLRMSGINKPGILPWTADCSGFVTCLYNWAGAADPSKTNWAGWDFTGSLVSAGLPIKNVKDVVPGDLLIVGPGKGDHVMIVIANDGKDPLCVSHGQESDPSLVHASQDTRAPHRYFRYPTASVGRIHQPPTTPPAVTPKN